MTTIAGNEVVILKNKEILDSFRTLHDLSKALNSSLDLDEVLEMILRRTAMLMRAEKVIILLLDKTGNNLILRHASGFATSDLPDRSFANIRPFDHCIVHKGTVITLEEVLSEKDRIVVQKNYSALLNMFFAPLEIQGKAYGLLGISGKKREFSLIELEIFCSLGSHAAVAIENASLYYRLRQTFFHTAEALAEAINSRDPYTGGHTRRVGIYSVQLGKALKLNDKNLESLQLAAILHDIGKIGIDDAILRKEGKLSADEKAKMYEHPIIAARILGYVEEIEEVILGVRHHHEWFDGTGYPDGLRGDKIPLEARIIAIVDTYDALTTDRPYRAALPKEKALKYLMNKSGSHFDPALIKKFCLVMGCPS